MNSQSACVFIYLRNTQEATDWRILKSLKSKSASAAADLSVPIFQAKACRKPCMGSFLLVAMCVCVCVCANCIFQDKYSLRVRRSYKRGVSRNVLDQKL